MSLVKLTLPVQARGRAKLDNLPQEVLDLILEDVQPKKALLSLLVQSRRMYHAVLPSLYRQVSFPVAANLEEPYKGNEKLLGMIENENPGLKHIQELDLWPRDETRRMPHQTAGYPEAESLLEAIPRNSLRHFSWRSWHEIPRKVLRLLWTRQRKLTNIELVWCKSGVDHLITELAQNPNSFHKHATKLRITDVGKGFIPGIVTPLLQRRKIESLTLDFWMLWENISCTGSDELKDIYHNGTLLSQIFAPVTHLKPAQRLALKELVLSAVDLTYNVNSMLSALETSALKTLRVTCCPSANSLFAKMSKLPANRRPRLHHLQVYHEQKPGSNAVSQHDNSDRTITAINDLLLSTTDTLLSLWVVMRGRLPHDKLLDPLAPGITNHGSSLLQLTVDIRLRHPPYDGAQRVGWFRREALEKLCARMQQLEMLYLPFPPVVANEYLDYRPEFRDYMATVLQIPTLKTLNVNTWPYPIYTELYDPADWRLEYDDPPYIACPFDAPERDDLPVAFYTHCLLYLVNWITELRAELVCKPHRPLKVVRFGMPETGHILRGLLKYLDPVYFVRVRTETEDSVMRQRNRKQLWAMGYGELILADWKIEWLAKRRVAEYEERFHHE
ncbi:MAG: hypothetical protein Q9208_007487 [Pyrenodesmia sp. 3 TL-2023]